MNFDLRYKILDQSLKIEYEVAKIISRIIRIDHPTSKTLSNKGSAIPFKVKVDLLYDLKRINRDEYNLLILFMEIRNQLVHNFEIDTMEKVLGAISKKSLLLSLDSNCSKMYSETNNEADKEHYLVLLLDKLHIELTAILLNQFKLIIKDIDQEQESINNKSLLETYTEMFKILVDTQKEVSEKVVGVLFEDEEDKNKIIKILDVAMGKIFKQKFESKYGALE